MKLLQGLSLATCFIVTGSCRPAFQHFEFDGLAQGTTYHITYYANDSLVARKQFDSIFSNVDSSLSIYKPYSLINRFNASHSGLEADEHLRKVVERSLAVFADSKGIFDITIYPIVRAWGFGTKQIDAIPDSGTIKTILKCVGSEKIYVKDTFLGKNIPCVQIDVNGIAQGYTVDVIADFLERKGIQNYLVEVGGELRVHGHKQPGSESMRIGIERPASGKYDEPDVQKIIELSRGAVTTSGSYRKQYQQGGKMISHLMDPRTGRPINNEMISATVVAKDAITADGYDNVLMVLGVDRSLTFMQQHPDMEAYLIFHKADGGVGDTATAGFHKMVKEEAGF